MTPPDVVPRRRSADSIAAGEVRALAVDDDPSYLAYIIALLRRFGVEAVGLPDGPAALKELGREHYDLLLCDLKMPGWDGLETIRRVRATPSLSHLHTILLTATEDLDTRLTALETGSDDFLGKSATAREILATLRAALRSITERRLLGRENQRLHELALTDALTGIPNRRAFEARADTLIGSHGRPFALVLLDLDGFKSINDEFGHLEGDRVVREVGRLLGENTRPSDLIARYGGDEFAVLLPATGVSAARSAARRIVRAIRAVRFSTDDGRSYSVGASFGVTVAVADETIEELIAAADRALLTMKRPGRRERAEVRARSA